MNLIDNKLLNEKYETSTEEKSYINQTVKTTKDAAKKVNADFDLYLAYYYGLKNESEFRDYLSLNYKRSLWAEEYAEETVTDKQIREYYETEVVGDIDASHILITVDTKKIEYGLISWCNTCYQQQENANKNINFHAYLLFQ